MRALITGVDGFSGRYMAAELAAAGYEVHGLVRQKVEVAHVHAIHVSDLADSGALRRVMEQVRPEYVIHLAGVAFVAHDDAESIYRVNVVGTRNLLQAVVDAEVTPKAILVASSAYVYGNVTAGMIDESFSPLPANDYAVSKLAMEYVARLYVEQLPIVVLRPFNYTGVGQSKEFLLPKILEHFRRGDKVIELGNLDVARDFSDVRSVVRVYRLLLDTPRAIGRTLNVCSGDALSLRDVLTMVQDLAGYEIEVRVNPAFVRANEIKALWGNSALLESLIGSVPRIELRDTLRWMYQTPPGTVGGT